MPAYRLRSTNGSLRPITAGRVVVADDQVRFQSPGTGGWVTVDSAALVDVARLDRGFNEADGRVRWVPEADVNATAAAAREEQAPDDEPVDAPGPATPSGTSSPEAAGAPGDAVRPAGGTRRSEPTAVSARDVRCPQCGEQDQLSGRRTGREIVLHCDTCGYDGPRVAQRTCPTCGGHDIMERPKAVVERARGTQLSIVGWTTVGLCRACDADELAAALAHGGAVLPKELPTVDPQTLREMGRGGPAERPTGR